MTIVKKKALLLTLCTGLLFGLMPNVQAQKVSEMSKLQRIKNIALVAPLVVVPRHIVSLLKMGLLGYTYSSAVGTITSLVGIAASSGLLLNHMNSIEQDESYEWSEYISGSMLGLGLAYASTELYRYLLDLFY